ncbi:MAG: hypothetical protein JXB50_02460 [Spirochaetes bacterium]|nr:hypothetical protein [Spirochaetota bacterium]
MKTETEEMMQNFIIRLINNPCFKDYTPLSIEGNIIQFFIQNFKALQVTITSNDYFSTLNRDQIESLFYKKLLNEINKLLINHITDVIKEKVDFKFLNNLLMRDYLHDLYQKEILKLIEENLIYHEFRVNLEVFLILLDYNIIDEYCYEIFKRKTYISNELLITEKLDMEPNMICNYIKIIILLAIIGYIKDESFNFNLLEKIKSMKQITVNDSLQKEYYENIIRKHIRNFSIFPDELVKRSVGFHINFNNNRTIYGTARLARILFTMAFNYNPKKKKDNGADSYFKSWLNLEKKNYKHFGLDIDMVDELYSITCKNKW